MVTEQVASGVNQEPGGQVTSKKWKSTSGYATWFMAGGAIRIADYGVIVDVI